MRENRLTFETIFGLSVVFQGNKDTRQVRDFSFFTLHSLSGAVSLAKLGHH